MALLTGGKDTVQNFGRSRAEAKVLSCVERLPSGVQVIALPHCTSRASVPGKANDTEKLQEKAPCLAAKSG